MVSFWPFKGNDTSAASFEKLLSSLSTKINKETARNDSLRQHQRRYRVLWTLYTSFAYILAALILTLVTGWQNWTPTEYTALAGAPVLIYGVRTGLDAFFNYRLANSQTHLNELTKQREAAITKLKDATKYNSTQQLLDKYGGSTPKPSTSQPKRIVSGGQNKPAQPRVNRTGIAPPPTANIPSRQPQSFQGSPQSPVRLNQSPTLPPQSPSPQQPRPETDAEFAPNAFSAPARAPTQDYASGTPRWLDRLLEVILGDDETQPKNRIVLICKNCRLVNGQAPPGASSLEDVGPWRCMACQTLNGQESEAKEMIQKIVAKGGGGVAPEAIERRATTLDGVDEVAMPAHSDGGSAEEDHAASDVDDGEDAVGSTPPSASTRSKAKQRNN